MNKSAALGISRCILGAPNRADPWPWLSGGARNPHVFHYTLRLLVSSLRLAPTGLALRFAPGETVLRWRKARAREWPCLARQGCNTTSLRSRRFFHKLSALSCFTTSCSNDAVMSIHRPLLEQRTPKYSISSALPRCRKRRVMRQLDCRHPL